LTSLAIAIIVLLLPLKKVEGQVLVKLKQLDVYGSIITLAWACLVLLGLSWAGVEYSWASAAVLAPLLVGLTLLGVFILIEAKLVALPLIPMYIFRDPTVAASMATSFANGAAFFASLYYLPQYLQVVRGDTPIRSGVLLLPLTLVQTAFSVISGYLVAKTGDYKWNLLLGFGIWTVGLGLMSMIDPATSQAAFIGFQIIVGLGAGQTFQTSLLAIQAAVDRKDMAAATGCRNFLRMLGGTISLAACATLMDNVVKARLSSSSIPSGIVAEILSSPTELGTFGLTDVQVALVKAAYCECFGQMVGEWGSVADPSPAKGVDACFWLMLPLTGASVFLTFFFIKRIPLQRADDEARKAEAKAWMEERKGKGGGTGRRTAV
jgi:hypothetical protein